MSDSSSQAVQTSPAPAGQPLIEFRQITKRFHAVTALAGVSFRVWPGEFHALCGENGAGKSTLMKILSGVLTDYEGEIALEGQPIRLRGPRDAEELGISIIHQELNLVADLSAAANIFLGREKTTAFGWLDNGAMARAAAELFAELGCQIDPLCPVRKLRIGDQQLVEIAKAISLRSRLLIMDEPTSALTESEVARLFEVIATLRQRGVTIVYISHKMDEVFRNADRITVLRDGKVIDSRAAAEVSPRQVTHLMVGREIEASQRSAHTPGDEVLRVRNLSLPWRDHPRQWRLKDVSLEVAAGEVVGVAGLMGAGRTELLESIYGASAEPPTGELWLSGQPCHFQHPREALAHGVAMVTEDRKRLGIVPQMSVGEHITLSSLDQCTTLGLLDAAREGTAAEASITQLRIKTAGARAGIMSLSGGNQQKCLIARALQTRPKLLLLDDPTRGIDVGAKAEIYELIDRFCREGLAILITSSELPELITVCDRILVLCEGRLTGQLQRHEFSEERLMELATATSAVA